MTTFETSRHFLASPVTVFDAFSDGSVLAQWWGPDGFTNEFEDFNFVEGGSWKFVMVGPDGKRYANASTFERVEKPHLLVIAHISPPRFQLTVRLASEAGGTQLTWSQTFEDPVVAQSIKHIVEPANEQNLNRLASILAQRAA